MKSAKFRWVLFQYKNRRELVILSKFKTKKEAEKAREKCPESKARKIGIGVQF